MRTPAFDPVDCRAENMAIGLLQTRALEGVTACSCGAYIAHATEQAAAVRGKSRSAMQAANLFAAVLHVRGPSVPD